MASISSAQILHVWTLLIVTTTDRLPAPKTNPKSKSSYVMRSIKDTMLYPKPNLILLVLWVPNTSDLRIIHDCSRPIGNSINSQVTKAEKYSFETVDSVMKHLSPNDYMCKVDLKAAYRHVGINPSNFTYTGLKFTLSEE